MRGGAWQPRSQVLCYPTYCDGCGNRREVRATARGTRGMGRACAVVRGARGSSAMRPSHGEQLASYTRGQRATPMPLAIHAISVAVASRIVCLRAIGGRHTGRKQRKHDLDGVHYGALGMDGMECRQVHVCRRSKPQILRRLCVYHGKPDCSIIAHQRGSCALWKVTRGCGASGGG